MFLYLRLNPNSASSSLKCLCILTVNKSLVMNYTPTKVGGFWEHLVVFRIVRAVFSRPNLQNQASSVLLFVGVPPPTRRVPLVHAKGTKTCPSPGRLYGSMKYSSNHAKKEKFSLSLGLTVVSVETDIFRCAPLGANFKDP